MLIIKAQDANDCYLQLLTHFNNLESSILEGSNHGKFKEERNVLIEMNDSYHQLVTLKSRNLSLRYLAGEFACYLSEKKTEAFAFYSKLWSKIDVDGIAQSNYGRLIFAGDDFSYLPSWYDYAAMQLKRNPDTKNAIIMIQNHLTKRHLYTKDRPCALNIQFFIRDGMLEMDVNLRSADLWLGLPYDLHWFSFIQQRMANDIGIQLGVIHYNIASLHVYEKHFDRLSTSDERVDLLLPIWDQQCEEQLPLFLEFERNYRTSGEEYCRFTCKHLHMLREFIVYNRKVNDYE